MGRASLLIVLGFIVIFGILLAYIIPLALISTDYLSRTYLANVQAIND
ncbi:MAG: hypothetical protein IIB41_01360 [Candidatus Marinimicrobia bacterium]|nr:hypothetical protein [Candidatus Neomarinimicrobiota bacterium]